MYTVDVAVSVVVAAARLSCESLRQGLVNPIFDYWQRLLRVTLFFFRHFRNYLVSSSSRYANRRSLVVLLLNELQCKREFAHKLVKPFYGRRKHTTLQCCCVRACFRVVDLYEAAEALDIVY